MSDKSPYETLGLTEDASFDEIQQARQRLTDQHSGDRRQVEAIETAYDAVLMDRLRLRQQGKLKVPDRIRFPEKITATEPKAPPTPGKSMPNWLQSYLDTPSQADILLPMGVYLVLMSCVALLPPTQGSQSPLQVTLLAGVVASIYFLNRKENKFGRSVLLTVGGLIAGLLLGSLLGAGLANVSQVNSDQFAAVVAFFTLWLVSSFLR